MDIFFLQLGNGLILGSVYALVALGINLIWSITDVPDFAQGSVFVVSAYVGYFAVTLMRLPYVLALLLAMCVGAGMAFSTERFLYRRWRGAGRVQVLCAIALWFFWANVANALWTSKPKMFPAYLEGRAFGFSYMRIMVVAVAAVLFVLVFLFIMKTKTGKAIRAASQDADMAQVLGISLNTINAVVFIMGGALSAAAAVLVSPLYSVYPSMADLPLLKALVVVILGGFGSVAGVLVGGLGLGVLESLGTVYVSSAYQHGYAFVILILVLSFLPKGLFGRM